MWILRKNLRKNKIVIKNFNFFQRQKEKNSSLNKGILVFQISFPIPLLFQIYGQERDKVWNADDAAEVQRFSFGKYFIDLVLNHFRQFNFSHVSSLFAKLFIEIVHSTYQ